MKLEQLLLIALLTAFVLIAGRIFFAKWVDSRKTAEALTDSEYQLQSIMTHMGDGLIAINEHGIIQIFNPASERMFGYPAQEVLGKNLSMLMPQPHRGKHDGYLSDYRKRGTSNVVGVMREFEAVHKNGSVFPIEIAITEMQMKDRILYAATLRDISGRKKEEEKRKMLEEELRISQQRFQLVIDGTIDGIWDWPDSTRDEVYWSPQWKALLGYRDDEITGSKSIYYELLHPDDRAANAAAVKDCLENNKTFDIEYRLKKKSGEYGWFHGKGIVSKERGITRMTGSITDISERKFAESVRDQLMKQLTTANEQLEQFAYIASHDLREPLRIVVSFSDLLIKEYGGEMNEEGRQYMTIMRTAAKKMEAMVADLLDYGRLGYDNERLRKIDCNKKLEQAKEVLAESISSTQAVIKSDPLPKVTANPLRFSRLLQNLIGNAIKYQRPGNPPVIHIGVENKKDHWQFSVKDNGIGIKPEYLDCIFAPFKRLHSDHEYAGTGIGLAICRRIVESFGGVIWVESEFGSGSTFSFTIPKRGNSSKAQPEKAKAMETA